MMYQVALFLHIVGVLGIFIALALEFMSLLGLRRTQTIDEYRQWQGVQSMVRRVGTISMVVVLLAGFYMMATAWGFVSWIVVTLGTLLLFPPLGAISGIRLAMIDRALAADGGTREIDAGGSHNTLLPVSIRERLQHPLLLTSIQIRA